MAAAACDDDALPSQEFTLQPEQAPRPELVVLLGAGASFASASQSAISDLARTNSLGLEPPPLTKDLFGPRFDPTLTRYPLADAVVPEIRLAMTRKKGDEGISLETYLREHVLRSPDPSTRLRFPHIPLYLQDVLHELSRPRTYATRPDNLSMLVNSVVARTRPIFVTLNYDTILDRLLSAHSKIDGMGSYIRSDAAWALIKLHGSVDWARRVDAELPAEWGTRPFPELMSVLGETPPLEDPIVFRGDHSLTAETLAGGHGPELERMRRQLDGERRGLYYPALSAPLGPDDELNCPDEHIEFLQQRLGGMIDGINLLVVGYSALDTSVIAELTKSGRPLRTLVVVDRDRESAWKIGLTLRQAFSQGHDSNDPFDGDFSTFVTTGGLEGFLGRVATRQPSDIVS